MNDKVTIKIAMQLYLIFIMSSESVSFLSFVRMYHFFIGALLELLI